MRSSLNKHRASRFALALLLLATVAGAGTVFGAVDRDDSMPLARKGDKLAVVAHSGEEHGRSHKPGDCRDLNASFLDPACHSSVHRKRHSGRLVHRFATAATGQTDMPETGPRSIVQ
jgi:hypothetical protein